ncbi:MAG: MotA/TolQ/ExbB proton channel family protein [Spirochaetes bacterium]|nr:MotA/TolQ/ExbB proton channel family protein [Spirochaetota bacterium]
MWPILGCSIFAMTIFIERLIMLYKAHVHVRLSIAEFKLQWENGNVHMTNFHPQGIVADFVALMKQSQTAREENERILYRYATMYIRNLEIRLNWLAIIGNVTPLLGLLGTVTGMIKVFMGIQNMHGQVNPSALAGGIWEALITTAAGLIVAIPTIIAYHFFEDRIDDITGQLKDTISILLEMCHD